MCVRRLCVCLCINYIYGACAEECIYSIYVRKNISYVRGAFNITINRAGKASGGVSWRAHTGSCAKCNLHRRNQSIRHLHTMHEVKLQYFMHRTSSRKSIK